MAVMQLVNPIYIYIYIYIYIQVCIFFHNKLYRGNRAVKIASGEYEAFSSPNLPPLASVGTEINGKSVCSVNKP